MGQITKGDGGVALLARMQVRSHREYCSTVVRVPLFVLASCHFSHVQLLVSRVALSPLKRHCETSN